MRKAAIIHIFGRVQGVGFRFYAQKKAIELSVFGFVQNKGDGSVYIEAEADAENLEAFVAWCAQGPQWAKVRELKVAEMPPLMRTSFQVQ